MKAIIQLIRPKDWAKNLFLFIPLFFAGQLFNTEVLINEFLGFLAFCCIASSIYIINDYRDRENDKLHPVKKNRPLASGAVTPTTAILIGTLLIVAGFFIAAVIISIPDRTITIGSISINKFVFVLGVYFILNIGYSFGLKNISILDIVIVAAGFVLRVKSGAVIAKIGLSEWLIIMVFLLALFMAMAKRRDDVLIKLASGSDMRKAVKGYNLEFINIALSLICAVIMVAYLMYTLSPETQLRLNTYRLYYTSLFVLAGVLRYLQLIFVQQDSQSPTKILYKDRFIQGCIVCWIISFYIILYAKDITIFK